MTILAIHMIINHLRMRSRVTVAVCLYVERYPSVTPAEAVTVADIAQAKTKHFTVLDALKGYH